MQQPGSKYFDHRHLIHLDTGISKEKKNHLFSEHGQVAYKIKGNHECSNMVANILPAAPPPPQFHPTPRQG